MTDTFDKERAVSKQRAAVARAVKAAENLRTRIIDPFQGRTPDDESSAREINEKIRSEVRWTIDELDALLRDL